MTKILLIEPPHMDIPFIHNCEVEIINPAIERKEDMKRVSATLLAAGLMGGLDMFAHTPQIAYPEAKPKRKDYYRSNAGGEAGKARRAKQIARLPKHEVDRLVASGNLEI